METVFRENEKNTNRIAGRMLMLFGAIVLIFSILGITEIVNFGTEWGPYALLLCPIFIIAIFGMIVRDGYAKPWDKHLILSAIVICSGMVHFLYPMSALFLLFGPILISIKYYDRRVTTGVAIMTFSAFSAAFFANLILEKSSELFHIFHEQQNAVLWAYPSEAIIFHYLPHVCIIFLTWMIASIISVSGRRMVIRRAMLSDQRAKLEAELNAAAEIQMQSMPAGQFVSPNAAVRISAFLQPAKEVGGDFYDYFMIDENLLGVVIADVSDKGMPAALFMMRAQSAVRYALTRDGENDRAMELGKAVDAINNHLTKNNPNGMFVTMWIGCIDCRTGVGKYINAGHLPPILRRFDGKTESLTAEPQIFLGAFENRKYSTGLLKLSPGDSLILITDGVTDARNTADETFGNERVMKLSECINSDNNDDFSKEICDLIVNEVTDFSSMGNQFDDITVMVIQFTGKPELQTLDFSVSGDEIGTKEAIDRLNSALIDTNCPEKERRNLCVAVDEICANIVDYAYADRSGEIRLRYEIGQNYAVLSFEDDGEPFDPLQAELREPGDEPQVGGLGIFFVKNLTDLMEYEYKNGLNCLNISRIWNV